MENSFLQDLPSEIIYSISTFLRGRDLKAYLLSASSIHKAISFHRMDRRTILGDYRISSSQERVLRDLKRCHQDLVIFKAPPSLGKTLITLLFLLEREGTHLIIVPPSLIDSWLSDVKKFFPSLYSAKEPERSAVLVFTARNKKHRNFFSSSSSFNSVRIVLVASSLYSKMRVESSIHYTWKVFDEAHLFDWYKNTVDFSRTILISASNIDIPFFLRQNIQLTTPIYEIKIPFLAVKEHIPTVEEIYSKESLDSLLSLIFVKHSHVILFFSKVKKYPSLTVNCKILLHKQSDARILDKFYSSQGKTVLFTTYGKLGTGHNLKGSVAIFCDCDHIDINPTIILQTESRFLRITNECPKVTFYFSCSSREALLQIRYSLAHVRVEQEYNVDFFWMFGGWEILYNLCQQYSVNIERLSNLEILYYAYLSGKTFGPSDGLFQDQREKIIRLCNDQGIDDPNLKKFAEKA